MFIRVNQLSISVARWCLLVRPEPTRVKHLSGALLLSRLLALPTNIRKALPGTNTLAYCKYSKITTVKSSVILCSRHTSWTCLDRCKPACIRSWSLPCWPGQRRLRLLHVEIVKRRRRRRKINSKADKKLPRDRERKRQTDRQRGGQMDRRTGREKDRWTDG
jgi:hypothetical protein